MKKEDNVKEKVKA